MLVADAEASMDAHKMLVMMGETCPEGLMDDSVIPKALATMGSFEWTFSEGGVEGRQQQWLCYTALYSGRQLFGCGSGRGGNPGRLLWVSWRLCWRGRVMVMVQMVRGYGTLAHDHEG